MKRTLPTTVLVILLAALASGACTAAPQAPATLLPPPSASVAATAPASLPAPATAAAVMVPTGTAAPTPAATATAGHGLPLAALQNAEYPSEVTPDHKVKLTNGSYEGPAAPGSASKVSVKLIDQWVTTGDLNGDGVADAAVILVESGGGTGNFYRLVAVLDAGGQPKMAGASALGDRVKINAVTIAAGEIAVDLVTHGPQDPMCCPTLAVKQTYQLQGDRLVQTGPAAAAAATAVNPGATSSTPAPATFRDPFAYCAAAGTVDSPDARWAGPKVPPAVTQGLMAALKLPAGTPPPPIAQNSFWRCMDGKVYACTVGANLPCSEKGNADRTPAQAMKDYCQANPSSDFIPMVVTGRATIYSWRCRSGAAEVDKQTTEVDARGFLANIWYQINP